MRRRLRDLINRPRAIETLMKIIRKSAMKQKSPRRNRPSRDRDGRSQRWSEQPIAESNGAIPCPLCGHAVDPKRMHPHMVRFHAAVL